jgi:hypothetical protein
MNCIDGLWACFYSSLRGTGKTDHQRGVLEFLFGVKIILEIIIIIIVIVMSYDAPPKKLEIMAETASHTDVRTAVSGLAKANPSYFECRLGPVD